MCLVEKQIFDASFFLIFILTSNSSLKKHYAFYNPLPLINKSPYTYNTIYILPAKVTVSLCLEAWRTYTPCIALLILILTRKRAWATIQLHCLETCKLQTFSVFYVIHLNYEVHRVYLMRERHLLITAR